MLKRGAGAGDANLEDQGAFFQERGAASVHSNYYEPEPKRARKGSADDDEQHVSAGSGRGQDEESGSIWWWSKGEHKGKLCKKGKGKKDDWSKGACLWKGAGKVDAEDFFAEAKGKGGKKKGYSYNNEDNDEDHDEVEIYKGGWKKGKVVCKGKKSKGGKDDDDQNEYNSYSKGKGKRKSGKSDGENDYEYDEENFYKGDWLPWWKGKKAGDDEAGDPYKGGKSKGGGKWLGKMKEGKKGKDDDETAFKGKSDSCRKGGKQGEHEHDHVETKGRDCAPDKNKGKGKFEKGVKNFGAASAAEEQKRKKDDDRRSKDKAKGGKNEKNKDGEDKKKDEKKDEAYDPDSPTFVDLAVTPNPLRSNSPPRILAVGSGNVGCEASLSMAYLGQGRKHSLDATVLEGSRVDFLDMYDKLEQGDTNLSVLEAMGQKMFFGVDAAKLVETLSRAGRQQDGRGREKLIQQVAVSGPPRVDEDGPAEQEQPPQEHEKQEHAELPQEQLQQELQENENGPETSELRYQHGDGDVDLIPNPDVDPADAIASLLAKVTGTNQHRHLTDHAAADGFEYCPRYYVYDLIYWNNPFPATMTKSENQGAGSYFDKFARTVFPGFFRTTKQLLAKGGAVALTVTKHQFYTGKVESLARKAGFWYAQQLNFRKEEFPLYAESFGDQRAKGQRKNNNDEGGGGGQQSKNTASYVTADTKTFKFLLADDVEPPGGDRSVFLGPIPPIQWWNLTEEEQKLAEQAASVCPNNDSTIGKTPRFPSQRFPVRLHLEKKARERQALAQAEIKRSGSAMDALAASCSSSVLASSSSSADEQQKELQGKATGLNSSSKNKCDVLYTALGPPRAEAQTGDDVVRELFAAGPWPSDPEKISEDEARRLSVFVLAKANARAQIVELALATFGEYKAALKKRKSFVRQSLVNYVLYCVHKSERDLAGEWSPIAAKTAIVKLLDGHRVCPCHEVEEVRRDNEDEELAVENTNRPKDEGFTVSCPALALKFLVSRAGRFRDAKNPKIFRKALNIVNHREWLSYSDHRKGRDEDLNDLGVWFWFESDDKTLRYCKCRIDPRTTQVTFREGQSNIIDRLATVEDA